MGDQKTELEVLLSKVSEEEGLSTLQGAREKARLTELEEVSLASIETVEGDGRLEEDSRGDNIVVGVVGGDEDESLALGLPGEGSDGV